MYNLAPILYSSRQFYHRKVVNILTTSRFIFTIPYYIRHIFNKIVRIVTGIFKKTSKQSKQGGVLLQEFSEIACFWN